MTNEERDKLNRKLAEDGVRAELASNQRIADAMAVIYKAKGLDVKREYPTPMDFTIDANAALEAAREIVGEFQLNTSARGPGQWFATRYSVLPYERKTYHGDTAPLALVAMIVAVLDERDA